MALLLICGVIVAQFAGIDASWIALPLVAGMGVCLLWRLPARLQAIVALALVLIGGVWFDRAISPV